MKVKMAVIVISAAVFVSAAVFAADMSGMSDKSKMSMDSGTQMMTDQKAGSVNNEFCPVSGLKAGAAQYEYNGKIYNFCCTDCIAEFKKNPEKYIKAMKKNGR